MCVCVWVVGGWGLWDMFKRLYDIAENRLVIVAEMYVLGWTLGVLLGNNNTDYLHGRRRC